MLGYILFKFLNEFGHAHSLTHVRAQTHSCSQTFTLTKHTLTLTLTHKHIETHRNTHRVRFVSWYSQKGFTRTVSLKDKRKDDDCVYAFRNAMDRPMFNPTVKTASTCSDIVCAGSTLRHSDRPYDATFIKQVR